MTKAVATIKVELTDEAKAVIDQAIEAVKVVRRENERLRAALAQTTASLAARGGFYDYERIANALALLAKEPTDE